MFVLQGFHRSDLVRGQDLSDDVLGFDANEGGDRVGGSGVVTGEQHRSKSEGPELCDGLCGGVFDGVRNHDDAADRAVPGHPDRSLAVGFRRLCRRNQIGRGVDGPLLGEPGATAHENGVPVHDPRDASAVVTAEVVDRGQCAALRRPGGHGRHGDGVSDGVLGRVLEGAGKRLDLGHGLVCGGVDGSNAHPPGRDGAGLVEQDGVDPAGGLQDLGALDEDAELGAAPGTDQQGGRRGKSERTGAGDDQDCHGCSEGGGRGVSGQQPDRQGGQGQEDDDRDEDAGHPVGQTLDLRLAVLGVLDEACHLSQLGVRADPGGPNQQPPAGVDGRADHGVAGADLDRHRLAGKHRGVDGGGTFGDDAVGGDLLAGANAEDVPDNELVDRDPDLGSVAQDGNVLGAHVQQGTQRSTGALLGRGFEEPSGQDEDGDHGGDLEVDLPGPALA